ncbi:MAG: DUF3108 domain-containing protein [Pseudomonadota bacterium]
MIFKATRSFVPFVTRGAPVAGIVTLAGLMLSLPATAETKVSIAGDYNLSIAGIPFAKAKMNMSIKNGIYSARTSIKTWGVAKLVVDSKTFAEASGRVNASRVRPAKYKLDSSARDFSLAVRMNMSGNRVRNLTAEPPLRKLPDRIEVTSRDKRNILDPLSAAIVPYTGKNGEIRKDACSQRVPIFDGWTRYDIKLYFRRFEEVTSEGFAGRAAVCGARWVPVAGHRPNKKTVVYLRENKNLEVWLVRMPENDFLLPYRIAIGTKSGTMLIKNKSMEISGSGQKHAARQ